MWQICAPAVLGLKWSKHTMIQGLHTDVLFYLQGHMQRQLSLHRRLQNMNWNIDTGRQSTYVCGLNDAEKLDHTFVAGLVQILIMVLNKSFKTLQLNQNAAAPVLTRATTNQFGFWRQTPSPHLREDLKPHARCCVFELKRLETLSTPFCISKPRREF